MHNFRAVFESNIFVFKENVKILVNQTIEKVWLQEIKNADMDPILEKKQTKKECNEISEIEELDEDIYQSNVVSRPSIEKTNRIQYKLKSFRQDSDSELSDTQSANSHVDLSSESSRKVETNYLEEKTIATQLVDRKKRSVLEMQRDQIDKKASFGLKLKDNADLKPSIENNLYRKGSLKVKPSTGLISQIAFKRHSLLIPGAESKLKDLSDMITAQQKKEKVVNTEPNKIGSIANLSNNSICKYKLNSKAGGPDDLKTVQRNETKFAINKVDKGFKDASTERKVLKLKDLVRKPTTSQRESKTEVEKV